MLELRNRDAGMREIRFVCDGPPGPYGGRFVEVENENGESVSVGEWRRRPDDLWELVVEIPEEPEP